MSDISNKTSDWVFGCYQHQNHAGKQVCHDCRNTFCEDYTVVYDGVHFCQDCFQKYYRGPDLTADLPGSRKRFWWGVWVWVCLLIVAGGVLGWLLPLECPVSSMTTFWQ